MPPKANNTSPANKQKKTDKKPVVPEVQLDDFFTKFLYKKKRNLGKKMTKIEELEKKKADELTAEQKETLGSKKETVEKVAYFDTIFDMYKEAYLQKDDKDEDAPQGAKTTGAAPAQATPVQTKTAEVDVTEHNKKNAKAIAQLISVSSYLRHPENRDKLQKEHKEGVIAKYGHNFVEGIGNMWHSVIDLFEFDNAHRTEHAQGVIENFLNKSSGVNNHTNSTYSKVHEAVHEIAHDKTFASQIHTAPKETKAAVHEEHTTSSAQKAGDTQITMVKKSNQPSRKESKRSRVNSEADAEETTKPTETHHEKPAETVQQADFHKKT